MKVTNKTDQTLTLASLQVVVEPGETVDVPPQVGESLKAQGWSAGKTDPTGKVGDVKDAS